MKEWMMGLAGSVMLLLAGAAGAAESFSVPLSLLIDGAPAGNGMYDERASNRYKQGDTLYFYAEPKNYKYKQEGKLYNFGFTGDILLVTNNEVVFGKREFWNATFKSHYPNKEIMLNGTLSLGNSPPGNYVAEFTVTDKVGKESAKFSLPFVIE